MLLRTAAPTLLLLLPSLPAQEQVVLRHRLQPGDAFAFAVTIESKLTIDDGTPPQSSRFRLQFAATVPADADDRAPVVECTLTHLAAALHGPRGRLDYDSTRTADGINPPALAQLLGQVFRVTLDGHGHVARVETAPATAAFAKAQLGADFAALFAHWFVPLPADPMLPGATWTSALPTLRFEADGCVEYRLQASEGGRATATATVRPMVPKPAAGLTVQEPTGRGELVFDLALGRPVTATLELTTSATQPATTDRPERRGTAWLRTHAEAVPPPPRADQVPRRP